MDFNTLSLEQKLEILKPVLSEYLKARYRHKYVGIRSNDESLERTLKKSSKVLNIDINLNELL